MTGQQDEKSHQISQNDEKKRKLFEQINNVKRVKQQQTPKDSLKNMTIKVYEKQKIKDQIVKLTQNKEKEEKSPLTSDQKLNSNEVMNSNFVLTAKKIQKNLQTGIKQSQNAGKFDKNEQERKQLQAYLKRQYQNSMKRQLNKIALSESLQKEMNQLQKQTSKKKKLDSPQKYNQSTCIEISSNQEEQIAKRSSIFKPTQLIVQAQFVRDQSPKYIQLQQELIATKKQNICLEQYSAGNQIFSKVKLAYVHLNPEMIAKLKKQKRRLNENYALQSNSDLKVNLQSNFVSVAKTCPIRMIVQKIKIEEKIFTDVKSYRFFVFKGSMNSLCETILNSLFKNETSIISQKFINLQRLYDWYTLAHLFSCSSDIIIVIEKSTLSPIIEDIYNFRCYCRNICIEKCLCLQFWVCRRKDPCSQRTLSMIERHDKTCKYSRPYKQMIIKEQNLLFYQRHPLGLRNYQNSCFMNTALQCLVACQPLTEYFLQNQHLKNMNLGNAFGTLGEITTRFSQFLREYFSTKKQIIDTQKFKKALCRWDNKYLQDQQQDSQQFLIQLLDWLKQDLNLNHTRPWYIQEENIQKQQTQKKAQKAWKSQLARNNSIIEYLMAGVLKSEIQCTQCSYKSQNFENFLTLPLPVTKAKSSQKWTFEIQVSLVYQNFRRKNETAKIKLQNLRYKDAIKQIKSFFGLKSDSQLIGIAYQPFSKISYKITNEIQGKQSIINTKNNPKQNYLLFYQHKKEQLHTSKYIEIIFSIHFVQNKKAEMVSCPRYLFFAKKQGSQIINVYKKLLSYFYAMMFKNKSQITEKQYLEKYLKPQNVPFKVYLSTENIQIFISEDLSLKNKSQIDVIFQNEEIFNSIELNKSIFTKKPCKIQQNFQSNQDPKMTIYECFKEFESTDIMDFENCWNCPKCQQKRKALKRISIYKAPQVLILFFKRFASIGEDYSHQMKKLQNLVSFSQRLNLQGYVQNQEMPYTSEKRPLKYKLFAVANHFGLSSTSYGQSGHYNAYLKKGEQWFYANDEKIGIIPPQSICSKNAYMLFYLRL